MNKEVEYLRKQEINNYTKFIKEVFDYEIDEKAIGRLINKEKVLVIKNQEKIIASVIVEECFEYIKNQKYYRLSYFGVLKEYRRMGYANMLFQKIQDLVSKNEINYLELASGNHRKAAHYFYQTNGFKIKDATIFVKLY